MSTAITNERGIALVITLLVVALLTITVVEFTYSVEVDQHMAHNALSALQASLLARSGVNLGEAALLHDDDPQVDAYTEDWGQVEQLNSQLLLPENMRLRVQIIDECGKLNINLTRPRNINILRAYLNQNQSAQPPVFASWATAAGQLLQARGAPDQISEAIIEYWGRLLQADGPDQDPTPGRPLGRSAVLTPTPNALALDFPSLDDTGVIAGLSASVIRRSRTVLTALDSNRQPLQVNANTAPREVLNAIIPDSGVVDNIISQRQEQALKITDLTGLLGQMVQANPQDVTARNVRAMLGVRSSYFLIRASAVVNPNPITGRGGISRSVSMLVRRDPRPGVPLQAAPGTPRWTLTQLDWQKEGGAALLQRTDQESGTDDPLNGGMPGMGG